MIEPPILVALVGAIIVAAVLIAAAIGIHLLVRGHRFDDEAVSIATYLPFCKPLG